MTFSNTQGISFYQTGAVGEADYWAQQPTFTRNAATSPYTSNAVDNIPTGTDIIALRFSGVQTLTFSQPVTDPVFSFASLNGGDGPFQQYYAFLNQDFQILSVSDGGFVATGEPANDCGYWGCGLAGKQVVDIGGGNSEYRLVSPWGVPGFAG